MKKLHILISIVLISCVQPKNHKLDLDGKWVLVQSRFNGEEIRNRINHTSLLNYEISGYRTYPALRFEKSDSTVIVPGIEEKKKKINYSYDKKNKKIEFRILINSETQPSKKSFIDSFYVKKFDINWNEKYGHLELKKDSTYIYMIPAEVFTMNRKQAELD